MSQQNGDAPPPASPGQMHDLLFRQIVETADEGVWLIDETGCTRYVNRRMAEMLGTSAAVLIGRPFADFLHPDERGGETGIREAASEGVGRHLEHRLVGTDGTLVWALLSMTPYRDEAGRTCGVLAMVTDITERKRGEERLAAEEARFRYLFEQNPHPMWVYDSETLRFLEVNEAAINLYGYSRAEFLRMTILDIRTTQEARRLQELLPSLPQYGFVQSGVWEHRTKDGRQIQVDIASNHMLHEGRHAFIVVAHDVSERVRAEAALRETERRFRQIADSLPGILWVTDADGRFTFLNRRFEEYTGLPAEQFYGQTTTHTSHPDDAAASPGFEAAMRDRKAIAYEYRVRRHDGVYRWFLDTCVPRLDDQGRFLGYIGMLTDIDDRRTLAQHLHQAQKMQAVGQLTGGVAHDFNNLLTVILGNAELLVERLTDPKLHELAEATRVAAERSADLVQRLLAFSRRQALQPSRTDVPELIGGMRSLLVRTLGETIDIAVHSAPSVWPVLVDRAQLESALLNLAINARDAMPQGGMLTVECANVEVDSGDAAIEPELAPGDYVMIAVSDTGSGMTEAVKRHALDPFFTTKEPGRGTGLGLSSVYGFIKQSGGHMKLYSELGQGTSVKLYLPRAQESCDGDSPAHRPPAQPTGGSETILVVEDNRNVRDYVAGQLRRLGYQVIEAANGVYALALLERAPEVELLFTDVVMPGGMNGRELADEACRRRPGLKVLFTTGYTESAIVHQGRLDPGVELLGKPYSRHDLARKVRAVLDGPAAADGAPAR